MMTEQHKQTQPTTDDHAEQNKTDGVKLETLEKQSQQINI